MNQPVPLVKNLKKPKKYKKKKKKHRNRSSSSSSSLSSLSALPFIKSSRKKEKEKPTTNSDQLLLDKEYLDFFKNEQNSKRTCYFFEDFPSLNHRNAFKIDKKGDPNNVCFDSVHYKQLPNYRVFDESKSFKSKLNKKKKISRLKQIKELKQKRYFIQLNKTKSEETELIKDKKEKPEQKTLSNKVWLYLEMKKELEDSSNDKLDKTSDFMKYLHENQTDVKKWLEFIAYQSVLGERSPELKLTQHERKLSIFDKAIEANPESFELKLERLKLRTNAYELDSIISIEQDFLSLILSEQDRKGTLNNLFQAWFEYLKFISTNNSSHLTFGRINAVYQKCFQFFLTNKINHKTSEFFLSSLIELVDIYCTFLSRAGYIERAICIFQSLIDFNFYISKNPNENNAKNRNALYEVYFEMGLPKFGENFATDGWLECLRDRDQLYAKLETELDAHRYDDFLDSIEEKFLELKHIRVEHRWLELEKLRSVFNWYPFYPKSIIGESAEDCCDPDRLVNYDDDISFLLFDLNSLKEKQNNEEKLDCLKFKLLCKFLKLLNLIDWDEESLEKKEVSLIINEDKLYIDFLNEKLNFFDTEENIFRRILDTSRNLNSLNQMNSRSGESIIKLLKSLIDFVRNCLTQAMNAFSTLKYKTNVTILKWKLEFDLIYLFKKSNGLDSDESDASYLNPKKLEMNLLSQARLDLSADSNRANVELWKQYAILKLLIVSNLKETRKVFDTLLLNTKSTCDSDFLSVYSLCIDYVLLELGIYYRQFNVSTSRSCCFEASVELSTTRHFGTFFDLGKIDLKRQKKTKEEEQRLSVLSEMLVRHCLNKDALHQQSKSRTTFQIGISSGTKLVLTKRDFQHEYNLHCSKVIQEEGDELKKYLTEKKLFLYHQVYSLFLVCISDTESVLDLNDAVLKRPINPRFHSRILEFYLNLLGYYYFQEKKISRFMYKTKLFAIVRAIFPLNKGVLDLGGGNSFMRLIQISFIRLKLENSELFCSQLIENNDVDLILKQIAKSAPESNASLVWLSLIYTRLFKLDRVLKVNQLNISSSGIGLHNEIRRLFDEALIMNPKSVNLWLSYFKFEVNFACNLPSNSKNRLLFVYYQSIKNLPYLKILYMNAVKYLPEKYNEIMTLLYNKEIRVYLPIQELNILLEPIKHKNEINSIDDAFESDNESATRSNKSVSETSEEEDKDEELKKVKDTDSDSETNEDNYNSDDSESKSSVENFKSIDF